MIEMPDFSKPYFYENNYNLTSDVNRLAKVLAHYEIYKLQHDVPGAIVECGVFKGSSLIRFTTMRHLMGNPVGKKVIGFDMFGEFPETKFDADQKSRQKFITDSGEQGIDEDQLMKVFKHKGIDQNVELVKGDVNITVPEYLKKNPELRISLLNIDVDVYEATKTCIESLYPHVVKGGVIVLDDYVSTFPGANKAVEDYLRDKKVDIKRFPFSVTPCYFVKQEM